MNSTFTDKNIINGRGQCRQRHPGNMMFRKLVGKHKQTYAQAPVADKRKISRGIVAALRRFGFNNISTGCYCDNEDKKAVGKTLQGLRDISRELHAGMDDSDTSSNTSSEDSCVNCSIHLLQSLSGEEPASQQEAHDMPRLPRPPLVHNQPSISDRAVSAILKEVGVKEVGSSENSVQLRDIREVVSELIRTDERFKSLIPR
jgi:hypothetical protein